MQLLRTIIALTNNKLQNNYCFKNFNCNIKIINFKNLLVDSFCYNDKQNKIISKTTTKIWVVVSLKSQQQKLI